MKKSKMGSTGKTFSLLVLTLSIMLSNVFGGQLFATETSTVVESFITEVDATEPEVSISEPSNDISVLSESMLSDSSIASGSDSANKAPSSQGISTSDVNTQETSSVTSKQSISTTTDSEFIEVSTTSPLNLSSNDSTENPSDSMSNSINSETAGDPIKTTSEPTEIETESEASLQENQRIETPVLMSRMITAAETVTVTLDLQGGTFEYPTDNPAIIVKGNNYYPSIPIKAGMIFNEWKLNGEDFHYSPVNENIVLVADWLEAVRVTYDTDGGTLAYDYDNPEIVGKGSRFHRYEALKPGYVLKGWSYEGKVLDYESIVMNDMTVVAQWDEAVNITYDPDGGILQEWFANPQPVAKGSIHNPLAPSPEKAGYVFKTWLLNGKPYRNFEPVNESITLVAQWADPVTVTYDTNGGEFPDGFTNPQVIAIGTFPNIPAPPEKHGYVFKEWHLNGRPYTNPTQINESITLVAQWADPVTVTYDTAGGQFPEWFANPQTIAKGTRAPYPPVPEKAGFILKEWQLNNQPYSESTFVNEDITLKAMWVETVSVSYDLQGGTFTFEHSNPELIGKGLSFFPPFPEKEGYAFDYWSLNGQVFPQGGALEQSSTLVAHWKDAVTITYDLQGGVFPYEETQQNHPKGDYLIPLAGATKTGMAFDGYLLNGKPFYDGSIVSEDITLVASWKPAVKVTYDANGGLMRGENSLFETYILPGLGAKYEDAWRAGYELNGWLLNGKPYIGTPINEDITLTAQWEKPICITVDVQSEQRENYTINIASGESAISELFSGHREGYQFDSWWIGDIPYNGERLYKDTTITAHWIKDSSEEITVHYDLNGGSAIYYEENHKIPKDSAAYIHQNFRGLSNGDLVFSHWTLNGREYDNEILQEDVTLLAQWGKAIQIRFDYNGGHGAYLDSSFSIAKGQKIPWQNLSAQKKGFLFRGWQLPDGSVYSGQNLFTDTTLKALWGEPMIVTIDPGEGYTHENHYLTFNNIVGEPFEIEGFDYVFLEDAVWASWAFTDGKPYNGEPLFENTVLVAQYAAPVKMTFDYGYDTSHRVWESFYAEGYAFKLHQYKRAGYTHIGYNLADGTFIPLDANSYIINKDQVLTLVWQKDASATPTNPVKPTVANTSSSSSTAIPRTGEANSKLNYLGLLLIALASFVLAFKRRKNTKL